HRRRRLAGAPRLFGRPVDQVDEDVRYLGESQDRIARPVEAGHGRAAECQLLLQGPAHGLDDVSFDLALHPIRTDDLPAIVQHEELLGADLAGRALDLDLGDDGHIGAHKLVLAVGDTATGHHAATLYAAR